MKKIRLTETDLKNIINKSVQRIIKEDTYYNTLVQQWEKAKEMMGADEMLNALLQYLPGDTLEDFIDTLRGEYDLPLDGNEDI